MKKGDCVDTPRFCKVKIEEVFESSAIAREQGFYEPTHYSGAYEVLGKHTGTNRMVFAAVKR
jgi:hypothetical protein